VATQATAQEFEFVPVDTPIRSNDRAEGTEILVGFMAGSDSNPGRAASGGGSSDTVAEMFAGLAVSRGNTLLGCRLAAETRIVRFADLGEFDYEESRINARAS